MSYDADQQGALLLSSFPNLPPPSPNVKKGGGQQDQASHPEPFACKINTPSQNFFQKSNFLRKDGGGNESMEILVSYRFDDFPTNPHTEVTIAVNDY